MPIHWSAIVDLDLEATRFGVDVDSLAWDGHAFRSTDSLFRPPLVCVPPGHTGQTFTTWRDAVPDSLGTEVVLLMQAGAHAYGLWVDDELIRHRADKRYVVRGNGKAQPTHLKTRGKSRYGSRLRLQNAKALVAGTIEDLRQWHDDYGPFDTLYRSCPQRAWSDFLATADPRPPFGTPERMVTIPLDVGVPCFAEVCRIREWLAFGEFVVSSEG